MKYIKKNRDAFVQRGIESSTIIVSDHDIVVELDSLSISIFDEIDRCSTMEELIKYTMSVMNSFNISQTNNWKEEILKELDIFIISLVRQGVLILTKGVNWQPCYFIEKENAWYVYAPYLRSFFSLSTDAYHALKKSTIHGYLEIDDCPEVDRSIESLVNYLNTPIALDENLSYHSAFSKRIVLLPTTACNLKCNYCYAWRSNKPIRNMSIDVAKAGIRYVAMNSINADAHGVDISFMGGGEPTCNWDVMKESVDYARKIAIDNNVPFSVTLTTNGVLTTDKLTWIFENVDNIKISFDGVESIQNNQRPMCNGSSFERVSQTMRMLSDAHASFLVRITVTNNSIDYLKESIEYIVSNYSPNSIIINPVYVCGSCASHGVDSIDYKKVCDVFNHVQNIGLNHHIDIVIPYDKVTYMDVPKLPFCGFQKGNCFLTPDGYLSACSEIDGADDPRATIFFFGKYDENSGEIIIDEEKEQQLHTISVANNEKCEKCSNNMFCPGPCLVRRIDENTMTQVLSMRNDVSLTAAFTAEEYDYLIHSAHSIESCIQCEMTSLLTEYQVSRILEDAEKLNLLAIFVSKIVDINCDGVIKAVQINTK